MNNLIAPSILSADFANLQADVEAVLDAGADWIHVDVMDGHFVPNLTIGAPVVKALRKIDKAFLDVHLMIDSPLRWIPDYINAGADSVTFHVEAAADSKACVQLIKNAGIKAGISLKPKTGISEIKDLLADLDLILVMTVEPGFGGQSFMHDQLNKIAELDKLRKDNNFNYLIQVDGGINQDTVKLCRDSGADCFVAGSYIFGGDYSERIKSLK